MFSRTKWIESIDRHRNYNTHYHTDDKVCFEWLLLRFMTEELLTNNRTSHPPTTPNTNKVDSGTLRQVLRAAVLSTP